MQVNGTANTSVSLPAALQQAAQLLSQKNTVAAEALLRRALAIWQDNPELVFLLGSAYEQAGRIKDSEALYRHALTLEPQQLYAATQLGHILRNQERYPEAVEAFHAAIAIEPRHADAHHGLAITLQRLQQFEKALASFDTALSLQPDHAGILTNRGRVLGSLNRAEEALASYDRALAVNPKFFEAEVNRAVTLQSLLRFNEALASIEKALVSEPKSPVVWHNHGAALQHLGRFDEAMVSFEKAADLNPTLASAWNSLGIAMQNLKRFEDAIVNYDKAIAYAQDYAEAWNNRGVALQNLGRFEEAMESFGKALAIQPRHSGALNNINFVLGESGLVEEGLALFARNAERAYCAKSGKPFPAHKIKHDQEQRDYLKDYYPGEDCNPEAIFRLGDGSRVARAVSLRNSTENAVSQWQTGVPQILVLDNFLTEEALNKLRRFCWDSTIWNNIYDDGYLGAMPEDGFACPLLAQISEELRGMFPEIFADHPLRYVWAFKYDSQLSGIEIHADKAAVNVNFWITPEDANLNPERGGMVVWNVAAPLDWDFDKYNGDIAASRNFITQAGAKPLTIPYRANRVVIFDSDLFHKTDEIEFKDGYLNRRINVTLLYGKRQSEAARS